MSSQSLRGLASACAVASALVGCESIQDTQPTPAVLIADETETQYVAVGVDPMAFVCESVAPIEAVQTALGVEVITRKSPIAPPAGVAAPCSYESKDGKSAWSFDLDCRGAAIKNGSALMVEYASQPGAVPVMVGRSGIDFMNSVLLWIEDDSPCYGRVMGPDSAKRLALARVVADNLKEFNAPSSVSYRAK